MCTTDSYIGTYSVRLFFHVRLSMTSADMFDVVFWSSSFFRPGVDEVDELLLVLPWTRRFYVEQMWLQWPQSDVFPAGLSHASEWWKAKSGPGINIPYGNESKWVTRPLQLNALYLNLIIYLLDELCMPKCDYQLVYVLESWVQFQFLLSWLSMF